ncbi:MAG: sulfate reduction electron transfer complex DsrMKJOP subunit DsrO [Planctomycetota bacterium]
MDDTRRSFLKKAVCGGVGLGCGFPLLGTACSASRHDAAGDASSSTQWAMVVDVRKCMQEDVRHACSEACHREHNVPKIPDPEEEVKWIWTEGFKPAFPDQTHDHMAQKLQDAPVLVLCNHCTRPPCVRVCPTQATWRREQDGIVMMDMHRCIGCRYCIAACPYGSRSFNWRHPREYIKEDENGELPSDYPTRTIGVVEKCNFCAERLRVGRPPACVEAAEKVPGGAGALTFGNVTDRNSEVSRVLRENHTICRRVSLGTGPNVFYIV